LGQALCIFGLAEICRLRVSDHERAIQQYNEALPLYRQAGSLRGEANCLLGLGNIAAARCNYQEASTDYCAALALYEQIQKHKSIAQTHMLLARIAPDSESRSIHVSAARAADEKIGELDLEQFDKTFGH
jgi:tetratricopeptide (TPR) repeat protein